MNEKQLRNRLIRLAKANPAMRAELLPIITSTEKTGGLSKDRLKALKKLETTKINTPKDAEKALFEIGMALYGDELLSGDMTPTEAAKKMKALLSGGVEKALKLQVVK